MPSGYGICIQVSIQCNLPSGVTLLHAIAIARLNLDEHIVLNTTSVAIVFLLAYLEPFKKNYRRFIKRYRGANLMI